jgi:hypothetical protein
MTARQVMFRFTIRDLLWLMVVVGLLVTFIAYRGFEYRKTSQLITDDYRAALNSQFEAAKNAVHTRMNALRGMRSGRYSADDICDDIERFVTATSEAIEAPALRLEQYQAALDAVTFLEKLTEDKYANDVEPLHVLNRVQYTRALVEGKIVLAQQELREQAGRK